MFRNNFSSDQVSLTDTKCDHHFPLEAPSSTKPIFLNDHDDFYHLDHHHHVHDHFSVDPVNGVHIGSNFDSFDAFPYGSSSTNPDFYDHDYDDIKPFADHANIAHHQIIEHGHVTMDIDFHQTGGGGGGGCSFPTHLQPIDLVEHSQDTAALHFHDAKPLNFALPDELSCVTAGHDHYKKLCLNNNIKHIGRNSSNNINNNSRFPRSVISEKNRKKSSVIKGQWTTEEDRLLVQLVEQHGIRKWSLIAQMLPARIGKQCRERWHNHLRPDIKKDTWSEEEDRVLIQAHTEIGNKWAEIAKRLPGRTENSIKNHWNATKRRQYSKRKCRSKYPRGSLLQDYIKSLNLDAANATTTRPALEEAKASVADDDVDNADEGISNNVVVTDPMAKFPINGEVEFCMDDRVVPDFDFDDMFHDCCYNVEALLDEIPGLDEKSK